MNRNHVYTFAATFAFVAAVMIFSSLITGDQQVAFRWMILFGLLGLGGGFAAASRQSQKEQQSSSTSLVPSAVSDNTLDSAADTESTTMMPTGTEAYQETTEDELDPEPPRPVAEETAQAGVTSPAAADMETVSEPLATEDGEPVGDAEVVFTDPIDRAAVDRSERDKVDVIDGTREEEQIRAGEENVSDMPNQPQEGERRMQAVNEDELETDVDRAEEAETGEEVDDSADSGTEVPLQSLTAAKPLSPEANTIEENLASASASGEADDLTRIEGIGPAMSAALNSQNVTTFQQVSQMTLEEIQDALTAAGKRFAPSAESWPEQASYAARGDWDGLDELQDSLIAGRYPTDD